MSMGLISKARGYLGMRRHVFFWWCMLGLYLAFVVEQCIRLGFDQLAHPMPFEPWTSNLIYAFMVALALAGVSLYMRNLFLYHDRFNFQERYFRRGAVLVMLGGAMGYFIRVVTQDATVTYATPLVLIGYVMLIYPVVGTPVRQETEDAMLARLQAAVDQRRGVSDGSPGGSD